MLDITRICSECKTGVEITRNYDESIEITSCPKCRWQRKYLLCAKSGAWLPVIEIRDWWCQLHKKRCPHYIQETKRCAIYPDARVAWDVK